MSLMTHWSWLRVVRRGGVIQLILAAAEMFVLLCSDLGVGIHKRYSHRLLR